MLTRLEIKNFALIQDVGLDFSPGLNILTGETGAGKSIILGALKLLLGDRALVENIRSGFDTSIIQGVFSLKENSPAFRQLKEMGIEEEEIIISREVNRQGRNLCRLNGLVVPLAHLKKVGQHLVDFHGQHEHQSLLDPGKHLKVLDLLCGLPVEDLKERQREYFLKYRDIQERIRDISMDDRERARRLDLLSFQLQEIREADLKEGEDEQLQEKLSLLANTEVMATGVERAYRELVSDNAPSIHDRLQNLIASMEDIRRLDRVLDGPREQLLAAAELIQDTARELRAYSEDIYLDPREMSEVEKRIEEIEKLKRKYGSTVSEIRSCGETLEKERLNLETMEKTLESLTREKEGLLAEMKTICCRLTGERRAAAGDIEEYMRGHLQDLALESAVFKIHFSKAQMSAGGCDHVEFMFSANAGEPVKALQKIISGGELSRVMLALKNIMADGQWVPTLVFDELDTGIGGRTLHFVGEKVRNLALKHQVICITHWPQMAALSHKHFSIRKEIRGDRTVTRVRELAHQERLEEMARMLDGGENGSLLHARTMLERSMERID